MASDAPEPAGKTDRTPPYHEDSEKGVLGSILLDANRVMDLCVTSQLEPESFFVPAHRLIYEVFGEMHGQGSVIDIVTATERLQARGSLDRVGGATALERLVDNTPTAAHAEYYIDIVRQKHMLRRIIDCAGGCIRECYASEDSADDILSRTEQSVLDIGEGKHGTAVPWDAAITETVGYIEKIIDRRRGLTGISTGYLNLDRKLQGLRAAEMIVLAARPSMGKTSLAMNIAEHVALGRNDPEKEPHAVGIFSLEMSYQALVMRMLCSRASVKAFNLATGHVSAQTDFGKLTQAASVLGKAPIFLDDTGGLDVMELRARARRMQKRHAVELIIVDYLQLLHSKEFAKQGRQIETSQISGNLKAMAKELKVPVLVLSQLSRAPEQRDKLGKPKLSDLRDSGAIEQDADVVLMLRRPCRSDGDERRDDETLAIVDVAKHRNGPTGEVEMNFEEDYTRFSDRAKGGVDRVEELEPFEENVEGFAE